MFAGLAWFLGGDVARKEHLRRRRQRDFPRAFLDTPVAVYLTGVGIGVVVAALLLSAAAGIVG